MGRLPYNSSAFSVTMGLFNLKTDNFRFDRKRVEGAQADNFFVFLVPVLETEVF